MSSGVEIQDGDVNTTARSDCTTARVHAQVPVNLYLIACAIVLECCQDHEHDGLTKSGLEFPCQFLPCKFKVVMFV